MFHLKIFPVLLSLTCIVSLIEALQDYEGTEEQKCVNCLCHARSGCWSRFNCAKYSVSFEYWKQANSPTLSPEDEPDDKNSYERCMLTENCIIATIVQYTQSFGEIDCNCDGVFDCKDRFAIHLFGKSCLNPVFGNVYARRFNECARRVGTASMLPSEENPNCDPEPF